MRVTTQILVLLWVALAGVAGCGKKGPLYLPQTQTGAAEVLSARDSHA